MRQSHLFTKTRKEAPADEVSKNAQLLIKAGFIHKEMAGAYAMLPLGIRVVQKISDIIREEMNTIGGLEMQSTALQRKEIWDTTNRWDDGVVDNWFKTKLKSDTELGLAFTHEEPMTAMMKNFIHSYKDLPAYPYDIRTVFRNEMRAKSGMIRGREFFWKALYSFSRDQAEHDAFYEKITESYLNVFKRVGLGDVTYKTFASGGTFSKYSHEFQTICEAGEDIVYVSKEKNIAVNKEVYTDEVLADLGLSKDDLAPEKAVEVGNIFSLGNKFSEPLELHYMDTDGKSVPVYMGSYGIGITRLMGVIAEIFSDECGLLWPESVAPFQVHLIGLGNAMDQANDLYKKLTSQGIEVLFDDRDNGAGAKFADADLIGIPYRVVISEKSLEKGGLEFKKRNETDARIISEDELFAMVKN
jgi:prolyl-tRNA synthetase